ncbi:MAG TPA: inositol monophosphatase family protein [Candidatus Limnocylindrales bacterium]|nr:inositol monophosphatase family protein [Candidatus Limnocylindrales bacterium]
MSAEAAPATRPGTAWRAELDFAVATARAAGRLLMEHYERLERIDHKSAKDVVTEADHLSEAQVIATIRRRYPADAIVAEESGSHERMDREGAAANGRTWVLDPLDGTVNYANGIPFFCVSLALVADGIPVVGVVVDPSRDEVFAATADGPATLDGAPIAASDKARLEDFVISMALGGRRVATRIRAIRKRIRVARSMGSAALALAYVANGRFDAFIQSGGLSVWDVAAAGLIAERAGARVSSIEGGAWFDISAPTRKIGLLAAPATHDAELLKLTS